MARNKKLRKIYQDNGVRGIVEAVHDIAVLETIAPQIIGFIDGRVKKPVIPADPFYSGWLNCTLSVFFDRFVKEDGRDKEQCCNKNNQRSETVKEVRDWIMAHSGMIQSGGEWLRAINMSKFDENFNKKGE